MDAVDGHSRRADADARTDRGRLQLEIAALERFEAGKVASMQDRLKVEGDQVS